MKQYMHADPTKFRLTAVHVSALDAATGQKLADTLAREPIRAYRDTRKLLPHNYCQHDMVRYVADYPADWLRQGGLMCLRLGHSPILGVL